MPKAEKEPTNTTAIANKIKYDGSKLFEPSYCYAKTAKLQLDGETKDNHKFEYYMTVGLNSNIKTEEFKRKHLNLIIVLDISGSMHL